VLSSEELNGFSAVHADSPIFISYDVRDWRDAEFTQAIFATNDGVSGTIPNCLERCALDILGRRSRMRFSIQIRNGLQELVR
jgi:hypothetical protein